MVNGYFVTGKVRGETIKFEVIWKTLRKFI